MVIRSFPKYITASLILLSGISLVDAWGFHIMSSTVWPGASMMLIWDGAPNTVNIELTAKNPDGSLTTVDQKSLNVLTASPYHFSFNQNTELGINYFFVASDTNDPNNFATYGPITVYEPFDNPHPSNSVTAKGTATYLSDTVVTTQTGTQSATQAATQSATQSATQTATQSGTIISDKGTSTHIASSTTATSSTTKETNQATHILNNSNESGHSHGPSPGVIVGAVLGGFAGLLLIVSAVILIRRCMYLQAIKDIQNKNNKNSTSKNDASPLVNMPPSNAQSLASTIPKPERTYALNGKEDTFVPVIHSPSISNNNNTESNLNSNSEIWHGQRNMNNDVYPIQNQAYPPQEAYSNVPYPSYDAMPSPTHFNFNDNSMYPPNPTSPTMQHNLYPPNNMSFGVQNDIYPPLNAEPFIINVINNEQSSATNSTSLYPPTDLSNLNSQKEEYSPIPELMATNVSNVNNEKQEYLQKPHYETVITYEKPHST